MIFILEDDILKIQDKEKKQNSGSINYYEREIQFNEKWEGLTIYAIITKEGSTKGKERAVVNNKLYIDQEFNGIYTIGFVGYTIEEGKKNYQISTNLRKISFGEGAGEIETEEHKLPTPSEWEVYLNQIQQFINEGNEIINKANTLNIEMIQNEKSVNIILTKKDGTTEEHIIYDGKDYILTEEDKQEIYDIVVPKVETDIQPILENIENTAKQAEVIARGRATGYVFETIADLDEWLLNEENVSKLTLGDNFYIVATDVPDYWWDGTQKRVLETEKPDLTEYAKKEQFVNLLNEKEYEDLSTNGTVTREDGTILIFNANTYYFIPEEE